MCALFYFLAVFSAVASASPVLLVPSLADDLSGEHAGQVTFYHPDGNHGACGTPLNNGDNVVAFAGEFFDPYTPDGNPNHNTLCGRKIEISLGGNSAVFTVADRCEACVGHDVDITPPFFETLVDGGLAVGRTAASWHFVD